MHYKKELLNKKRGLGRGLNALISEAEPAATKADGKFLLCPIMDISPSKTQPRKSFGENSLKDLADSISEKGVLEPLLVRRTRDGFELIAGERRWRAAKMAGLAEVPAVVTNATEEESLEIAIIENIQREDLNAIEEAEAYRSLMGFGLSQEEVAKRVGKERATVANYLRLLKLPIEAREELIRGSITMGHARALLSVESHALQVELLRKIISKGLSVRETENLVNVKGAGFTKTVIKKTASHSQIEDELMGIFGTKVSLKDRKGKGKIEINYFSAEERERLLDILRSVAG